MEIFIVMCASKASLCLNYRFELNFFSYFYEISVFNLTYAINQTRLCPRRKTGRIIKRKTKI